MSQECEDLIINPFYYAQDTDDTSRYFTKIATHETKNSQNTDKEESLVKPRKPFRKRKSFASPPFSITTNIVRRTHLKTGQKLIKICIYDVKNPEDDSSYYSDSENSSVSAQYVVEENHNYDVIMDAANSLIRQIGKKLYDCDL